MLNFVKHVLILKFFDIQDIIIGEKFFLILLVRIFWSLWFNGFIVFFFWTSGAFVFLFVFLSFGWKVQNVFIDFAVLEVFKTHDVFFG